MVRSSTLFVKNISDQASREDLRDYYSRYGQVAAVIIPLDYRSGRVKGYAFVEFDNYKDAEYALDRTQGARFMGREIEIEFAMGTKRTPEEMHERRTGIRSSYGQQQPGHYSRRPGSGGGDGWYGGSPSTSAGQSAAPYERRGNNYRRFDDRRRFERRDPSPRWHGGGGGGRQAYNGPLRSFKMPAMPLIRTSQSRSRSLSRSRSRSRSRPRYSRSKSVSRSRSKSPPARSRSRSASPPARSRSQSRSPPARSRSMSGSRSNSPK